MALVALTQASFLHLRRAADHPIGAHRTHPGLLNGGRRGEEEGFHFYRIEEVDVGLVHLEQPAADLHPGIVPAPIAGANALDAFGKGTRTTVTQVGYGVQIEFPFNHNSPQFIDGSRNTSEFPVQMLRETIALNHANPRDSHGYGTPCSGDSGSPWFFNGVVGVVFDFSFGTCFHGGGPRLDTGRARDFLRSRGLVP